MAGKCAGKAKAAGTARISVPDKQTIEMPGADAAKELEMAGHSEGLARRNCRTSMGWHRQCAPTVVFVLVAQ